MNPVKIFLCSGTRVTGAKPLDLVAARNETFCNLMGQKFGATGARILGATPVKN
jgi:hypothetical protein